MRVTQSVFRHAMRVAYALVLLAALYMSFKIVLRVTGTDGDSLNALTLWFGIRAHGLRWLGRFIYTPDNWLLSVVPFNFISFALFGAKPYLPVVTGWLVLVAAALMSAALARELGARIAARLLPVILLLPGFYAYVRGFIAHPASHDVTNLFGLAALFCALRAAKTGGYGWLGSLAVLLACGTISDPWMAVSYDLPLLLFAMLGLPAKKLRYPRMNLGSVACIALAAIILGRTHLLGIMHFLPDQLLRVAKPGVMGGNAFYFIKDLGGLLNLVPSNKANGLGPALISLFGCGAAAFACYRGARGVHLFENRDVRSFLIIAGFSTVGTSAAFLLLSIVQADYSVRFLVNFFYLSAIAATVTAEYAWHLYAGWQKLCMAVPAALLVMSGVTTTYAVWSAPGIALEDDGVYAMIDFLAAHGLTYGYGNYHGAEANAVTVMSAGKVTMRPVEFNSQNGMMIPAPRVQSAPAWLTQADFPPTQQRFFIMVAPDGEECNDAPLCVAGLTTQFGQPTETLHYGNAILLVWNHPLLGYPYTVSGEYWGGRGWAWMGRSLTIRSRRALEIPLRADAMNGPVTLVLAKINGTPKILVLQSGQTATLSIPPDAVTEISATPDFPAGDARRYTVMVNLPQPTP